MLFGSLSLFFLLGVSADGKIRPQHTQFQVKAHGGGPSFVPLSVLSDVRDPRVAAVCPVGLQGWSDCTTAHVTQGHLSLTVRRTGDTGIFTSTWRLPQSVTTPRDLPLERHAPISGEYEMTRLVSSGKGRD